MSEDERSTRRVNVRVRQVRFDEVRKYADSEDRSAANMVDVLLGEAIKARRAKEPKTREGK